MSARSGGLGGNDDLIPTHASHVTNCTNTVTDTELHLPSNMTLRLDMSERMLQSGSGTNVRDKTLSVGAHIHCALESRLNARVTQTHATVVRRRMIGKKRAIVWYERERRRCRTGSCDAAAECRRVNGRHMYGLSMYYVQVVTYMKRTHAVSNIRVTGDCPQILLQICTYRYKSVNSILDRHKVQLKKANRRCQNLQQMSTNYDRAKAKTLPSANSFDGTALSCRWWRRRTWWRS
jgi:hypothetical protein